MPHYIEPVSYIAIDVSIRNATYHLAAILHLRRGT